jgi:hypothetical protein
MSARLKRARTGLPESAFEPSLQLTDDRIGSTWDLAARQADIGLHRVVCAVERPAFNQVLRCRGGARVKHRYGPSAELVMVRASGLAPR